MKTKTAISYKGANGLMFKFDSESKTVSGYFASFNTKDADGDILWSQYNIIETLFKTIDKSR